MTRTFDIRELLRVAIYDEQSGVQFYRNFAGFAENPLLREAFSWMSDREHEHLGVFRNLLEKIGDEDHTQYPDIYADYLEMLVSEGVPEDMWKSDGYTLDDITMIKTAMKYEQRQLMLQQDIADIVGDNYRDIVNQVLQEERDHLVKLANLRKQIRVPEHAYH